MRRYPALNQKGKSGVWTKKKESEKRGRKRKARDFARTNKKRTGWR
jgi:hypothetical protein